MKKVKILSCLFAALLCVCNKVPEYCGEGNKLDPETQFCFEGKTYDKCGGSEYDAQNYKCESNVLKAQCGSGYYDVSTEFCSVGEVYPKCGGNVYDPATQKCEGNILKAQCGSGGFFYSVATEFCSGNNVYSKCGGQIEYDPSIQVCDAGSIKTRCGTDYYDTSAAFCVSGVVYAKCRGQEYNPANQKCEAGVLKNRCGASNNYFAPDAEFCLDNTVYEKCNGNEYNPATYTCKDVSMVFVQGGTFTMGCTTESDCQLNEKPAFKVTLSDFYIGRYEITQKQWDDVMGTNLSNIRGEDLPVVEVPWDSVQVFIRKLNAETGRTYRLPTEAEWEFAARGGIKSEGYKYAGSDTVDLVAWHYYNGGQYNNGSESSVQIIGTKRPNELGIYDMSGNAAEMVSNYLGEYSAGSKTNPMGSSTTLYGVRGAYYYCVSNFPQYCRVSYRDQKITWKEYACNIGFRLARTP